MRQPGRFTESKDVHWGIVYNTDPRVGMTSEAMGLGRDHGATDAKVTSTSAQYTTDSSTVLYF